MGRLRRPRAVKWCLPPNELDGNPYTGNVLTTEWLRGQRVEAAVSLENVEEDLNEFLLWHGTSRASAEAIVCEDFRISKDAMRVSRYGHGAYFAENLDKSLTYAKDAGNGIKYALLCRVCCGQMHYTEKDMEIDVHKRAQQDGKDSVLASPSRGDPREFIVLGEEQVYPEYILELDTRP